MIEELAVGAQFNLPYIHVVVNNSYLGLIRQSQRGFDMDFCVQLAFENINSPELGDGYGVDHVKVAEGLGCKAMRVSDPDDLHRRWRQAKKLMAEYRVPVVVEVILERVTNISMGTEIDNVVEFEELADARRARPHRHRAAGLPADERQMHVVVAPDKFKGSLTAREVAARVAAGICRCGARGRGRCRCRWPTAATGPSTPPWRPASPGVPVRAAGRPARRSTRRTPCARASRSSRWPTCPGLRLLPGGRLALAAPRPARTAPGR